MKSFALIFTFLFAIGTSFSQEMESTLEQRLTKYLPFLEPKPCSVFLVDFKSPAQGVKVWAKMLGLVEVDPFKPNDTSHIVLQYLDPEAPTIVYGFIIDKKNDMYIGAYVNIQFKNHFIAIDRLDRLKTSMYLHWGNSVRDKTDATSRCSSDGMTHFITTSRTGETLMVTVACLELFRP